jgi:hypothetical protein
VKSTHYGRDRHFVFPERRMLRHIACRFKYCLWCRSFVLERIKKHVTGLGAGVILSIEGKEDHNEASVETKHSIIGKIQI